MAHTAALTLPKPPFLQPTDVGEAMDPNFTQQVLSI